MRDPFLLDRPAIVSFSGGRTSGYMLWRVLQAFGGSLPDDVVVVFNNTGKEREETLEFVAAVGAMWNVRVRWLEYRNEPTTRTPKTGKRAGQVVPTWHHLFREVDFATASRGGEPFDMAIRSRQILPNQAVRYCTGEMKIRTTYRFVRDHLCWREGYDNALGIRADEPHRVAKLYSARETRTVQTLFGEEEEVTGYDAERVPGEEPVVPLYRAGGTLDDVMAFWQSQRGGAAAGRVAGRPRRREAGLRPGVAARRGEL